MLPGLELSALIRKILPHITGKFILSADITSDFNL